MYIAFITICVHKYRAIFIILLINIIATFFDISWFLQGLEEFKKTAVRNYIVKILSLILLFLFVKKPSDIAIYTVIIQGSTIVGNLTLWVGLKKYLLPVTIYRFKIWPHIMSSLIYFVPTLATTLFSYFDKTMIGLITHSDIQNGYYEQAYKVENISITIISSLSTVVMPRAVYLFQSKDHKAINRLLKVSSQAVIVMAVPLAIGLIAISKNFVPWFLGKEFTDSIPILNCFAILILIDSIKDFYTKQVVIPSGEQIFYDKVTVFSVILNIVGNYFLILKFQAIGACFSSILTELLVLIVFEYKCRKIFSYRNFMYPLFKYMISGLIMGISVYSVNFWGITNLTLRVLTQIIIGIAVYSLILILIKDDILKLVVNKFKH